MANFQYTENLTEEQLDAMAGSETLRYQATSFGVTRNNKVLFILLINLRLLLTISSCIITYVTYKNGAVCL